MLNKEVIEQLKSLKAHCETMKESGEEWKKDVQALEYAIKELERTAQEVPVHEQLSLIEANILLSKKFKELALMDELSDSEFKNMLEIYSILFNYHP